MARTGGAMRVGNGCLCSRSIARASRAVAGIAGGVEACPPVSRAVRSTVMTPRSATPIIAVGTVTPGTAPSTTAPPSSMTSPGRTPRSVSSATIAWAPSPAVSSL